MADGYARVSGRIAVVAAQTDQPRLFSCRRLPRAYKASIPVVALVQDVERPQLDRNAFQELDHFALFSSCAKSVRRILTATAWTLMWTARLSPPAPAGPDRQCCSCPPIFCASGHAPPAASQRPLR